MYEDNGHFDMLDYKPEITRILEWKSWPVVNFEQRFLRLFQF